jgi:hypothetical protein
MRDIEREGGRRQEQGEKVGEFLRTTNKHFGGRG